MPPVAVSLMLSAAKFSSPGGLPHIGGGGQRFVGNRGRPGAIVVPFGQA
jgi:hypothetical protein